MNRRYSFEFQGKKKNVVTLLVMNRSTFRVECHSKKSKEYAKNIIVSKTKLEHTFRMFCLALCTSFHRVNYSYRFHFFYIDYNVD